MCDKHLISGAVRLRECGEAMPEQLWQPPQLISSRPNFQVPVVETQVNFQKEAPVYQIVFGSSRDAVYGYGNRAHAFGKSHVHFCAQQLRYHPQDSLIWFFSLSLLCPYVHCLSEPECCSRHKDYEPSTDVERRNSALRAHLSLGGSLQTFRSCSKAFTNLLRFVIFR